MPPASRRNRSGRAPARTLLLLALAALGVFLVGFAVLYGRSENGLILRARLGLPADRAGLTRTLSKTIREELVAFGIPPASQVIHVDEKAGPDEPRVRWTAYLPGRASTLQLNARLTGSLEQRRARVFDAWEDTLAAPGSAVHLLVGAGGVLTHEIVLQRRSDVAGAPSGEPARLLLVVDEFGPEASDSLAGQFLALGVPVTGAVLPGYRSTRNWANRLSQKGHEVLVQLPLEPEGYPKRDPGPGAILVDMPSGQIQRLVQKHLKEVPHATGATSFMGSLALADVAAMDAVMTELKRGQVYFLDPRDVTVSVAVERAAQAGVTTFRVDQTFEAPGRFETQVKAMQRQLDAAVSLARRRGYAIVLAHPDPAALALLRREIPKLLRSGVRFEPVSALLQPQAY
jgi:hypothetical protein